MNIVEFQQSDRQTFASSKMSVQDVNYWNDAAYCLDAPNRMPKGSTMFVPANNHHEGFATPRMVYRDE